MCRACGTRQRRCLPCALEQNTRQTIHLCCESQIWAYGKVSPTPHLYYVCAVPRREVLGTPTPRAAGGTSTPGRTAAPHRRPPRASSGRARGAQHRGGHPDELAPAHWRALRCHLSTAGPPHRRLHGNAGPAQRCLVHASSHHVHAASSPPSLRGHGKQRIPAERADQAVAESSPPSATAFSPPSAAPVRADPAAGSPASCAASWWSTWPSLRGCPRLRCPRPQRHPQ